MLKLLDVLFGCSHKHFTFPITLRGKLRRSGANFITGTYVVCLDCGKEFPYDWAEMKLVSAKPRRREASEPITILTGHKVA